MCNLFFFFLKLGSYQLFIFLIKEDLENTLLRHIRDLSLFVPGFALGSLRRCMLLQAPSL